MLSMRSSYGDDFADGCNMDGGPSSNDVQAVFSRSHVWFSTTKSFSHRDRRVMQLVLIRYSHISHSDSVITGKLFFSDIHAEFG